MRLIGEGPGMRHSEKSEVGEGGGAGAICTLMTDQGKSKHHEWSG
jgi:hypothetical protein